MLPALGVFCDIDDFQVLFLSTFDCISKIVDSSIQTGYIWQVGHIKVSNGCGDVLDEECFLFAIFDDWVFGWVDTFLNNKNGDDKRDMI